MLGELKLVLVCVMLVLLSKLVLFVPKIIHDPDELLHHVAFILSTVLLSMHFTYSCGIGHIAVVPLVGDSPVWYGAWLPSASVVNVYVVFVQLHPSVRLRLHQYCVLKVVAFAKFCVMFCPLVTPVFVFPSLVHVPLLLLHHCVVMVCPGSCSLAVMYSGGVSGMPGCWFSGHGWVCVGGLLVVKLYVVFV